MCKLKWGRGCGGLLISIIEKYGSHCQNGNVVMHSWSVLVADRKIYFGNRSKAVRLLCVVFFYLAVLLIFCP